MSNTAERAFARSTNSCSLSGVASPSTTKRHPDLVEAVAHLVRQAERAADVHVALELRLHLGQPNSARRRDVDERGGQARGQRMQQHLRRVGAGVGADQDRRLAGVELERLGPRGVFAARGVEVLDRRAVVRAVDPAVGGAELERPELRLGLDRVEGREQRLGVDAVADPLPSSCSRAAPSVWRAHPASPQRTASGWTEVAAQ